MGFGARHGQFHKRAPNAACSTGGMYKTPTMGQVVDSSKPVTLSWDTTCLAPPGNKVNVYLYAPSASQPRIYLWENVPFSPGKMTVQLMPKWWHSTPNMALQFSIAESNASPFSNSFPAGPIFNATYTAPADGKTPSGADVSKPDTGITNMALSKSHLTNGQKAAAIIMPLLIVIILASIYWVRRSRQKGKEDRKRWSEAMDKRMSRISTDWKSVTPSGAKEAVRQSMAFSATQRFSIFDNGVRQSVASDYGRPQSTVGSRGNGLYQHNNVSIDSAPPMAQILPALRSSTYSGTERVSRVSFANDPRPKSRYKENSVYGDFPPLPPVNANQTKGPLTLSAEDIRARLQGVDKTRDSMDEVMPALSMMRTGADNDDDDDTLLLESPTSKIDDQYPQHPSPAQTHDRNSAVMQAIPANVMSPDDMLRAYAARSQSPPAPAPAAHGLAFPARAANYDGNGMRMLYSSTTPGANVMGGVGLSGKNRLSVSRFTEDDAYIGTAT